MEHCCRSNGIDGTLVPLLPRAEARIRWLRGCGWGCAAHGACGKRCGTAQRWGVRGREGAASTTRLALD
jgi:hypothetical protein